MQSLPWNQLKIKAESLLNAFKYQEASDLLLAHVYNQIHDERERQLMLAKVYIYRGLFNMADEALENFQTLGGDQERWLVEKLDLYYMAGHFAKWNTTIAKALTQFEGTLRQRFCNLTVNEQIALLKHFEEAGFITEVIEGYEFLKTQKLDEWESLKIDAQLLRLCSLWKIKAPLAALYQKLVLLSKEEISTDFYVEVQHALILAELNLLGAEVAQGRLQQILSSELYAFDKRLILYDFIELYVQNEKKRPVINFASQNLGELSVYEAEIQKMVSHKEKDLSFNASEMTSSSCFRLVAMANNLGIKMTGSQNQICIFLVEQFSAKTKKLWKTKLNIFAESDEKMAVSFHEGVLSCEGKELSLKNQPILASIVDLVSQSKETVSLQALSWSLFQQEADLSIQDRLRAHINRLNRIFESQLGINKPLKIREGQLVSNIQFIKAS